MNIAEGKKRFMFFAPNRMLLLALFVLVFLVPFMDSSLHRLAYSILNSCIFILSALSIHVRRKRPLVVFSLVLVFLIWIAFLANMPVISFYGRIIETLTFVYIVIRLIRQTAMAQHVNEGVIADSISGYLMAGIIYAVVSYSLLQLNPGAYQFPDGDTGSDAAMSRMFYYTFVTYSSTGYGDILPVTPGARSLSTLISVSGQMYVAIIIALLVGKFSSIPRQQKPD